MVKNMVELKYISFEKPGKANTIATLENAKSNADIMDTKKIIIASTKGGTIQEAVKIFDPKVYKLICVTHNYGFKEGIDQEFPTELRQDLESKGVKFVSGVLAFSGVGSALLKKYQFFDFTSLFSKTIKALIGDGIKVCMEIVLMAVDAGFAKLDDCVISVGGTGTGADCCCLFKAASSRMFDKLRLQAILAKPL
jgi:uncharacterized protein